MILVTFTSGSRHSFLCLTNNKAVPRGLDDLPLAFGFWQSTARTQASGSVLLTHLSACRFSLDLGVLSEAENRKQQMFLASRAGF